jgi:hypothetical protein
LEVCPACGRAYKVGADSCPQCQRSSEPYQWDQESGANIGCLLALVLFALLLVLSPLLLLSGFLFR